jgi:hypothetical protein
LGVGVVCLAVVGWRIAGGWIAGGGVAPFDWSCLPGLAVLAVLIGLRLTLVDWALLGLLSNTSIYGGHVRVCGIGALGLALALNLGLLRS